jgi:hypothetical protein
MKEGRGANLFSSILYFLEEAKRGPTGTYQSGDIQSDELPKHGGVT